MYLQETSLAREILTKCYKIMIILESQHFLSVAIDHVRWRRSERLGTLNACEKFRFSEVRRREYALKWARGVYECHSSALEVLRRLKISAFRSTAVIFVRPVALGARIHVADTLKNGNIFIHCDWGTKRYDPSSRCGL